MTNVTYLLGAGASANTIPVVNNLTTRIKEVVNRLHDFTQKRLNTEYYNKLPESLKKFNKYIDIIAEDLGWLVKEAANFQTIDTLARMYYLTENYDSLKKLKKTLVLYFTLEQILFINSKTDQRYTFDKMKEFRYESFFAAALEKQDNGFLKVRDNIKILSWNYDSQLELALKTFKNSSLDEVRAQFQILPNRGSLTKTSNDFFNHSNFGVIKLNGSAIWSNPIKIDDDVYDSAFDKKTVNLSQEDLLGSILEEFDTVIKHNNQESILDSLKYFNFSWESDPRFTEKYTAHSIHREIAMEVARKTNILVIIGYSFPVFNRETDKKLIDSMKNIGKIYIQDPYAENILSTLKSGFSVFYHYSSRNRFTEQLPVELQTSTDQFLIPFELS